MLFICLTCGFEKRSLVVTRLSMVSIIIPVYNVEKYISQCLDSIKMQTYRDWECILVNDASPDNCLRICEDYVRKDNRFIILNKTFNEGIQKARYDGLTRIKGDYVTFVDSDDWLNSTMLETSVRLITQYNCDYVEMATRRVLDRFGLISRKLVQGDAVGLVPHHILQNFYISFFGINSLSCNLWGKLYRTDLLKKGYPSPVGISYAEDAYVNLKLFPHLKSIYVSDKVGYNYRWGGMTSKYNPSLLADAKKYYWLRRTILESTEIPDARYFLDVEAKNVLRSDIKQKLLYKGIEAEVLASQLQEELKEQIWCEVRDYLQTRPLRDAFSGMLITGDVKQMIESIQAELRHTRRGRFFKRMASRILTSI